MHGNIRPENLFEENDGLLKLTDLGFSFAHASNCSSEENPYIAPDFLVLGSLDEQSDIYCLGVSLFHIS